MRRCHPPDAQRLAAWTASLLALALGLAGCRGGPPPTLAERGDAAFAAGRHREAEAFYVEALAQSPGDAAAIHGRARVALALRDPEASLRHYGELARVSPARLQQQARPDYAQTLFAVGKLRLAAGRAEPALEALRALQRLEPGHPGFALLMGRTLTAQGERLAMHARRDEALAHFEEAIGFAPELPAAWVGAVQVLLAGGKRKEALALLGDARRRHPSDQRMRALTVEAMGLH